MLISKEYLSMQRLMHQNKKNYGVSGKYHAGEVREFMKPGESILDYGCGQRTLEAALGFKINNYDPCIPGLDAPPEPADFVVCTDVLEHIEPECVDAVLDDIRRLTKRIALLSIHLTPALKHLPDGRNAHLIIEDEYWWEKKIKERFDIEKVAISSPESEHRAAGFLVTPKC